MDLIVFILLAAVMIAVAFYLVAMPLLGAARRSVGSIRETSTEQERLDELLAQREAAFQALRELNFDHKVGKLSDEDFAAFEGNLKQHAANTLRALDEWEAQADDDLDTAMEREIRARRQAHQQAARAAGNGHDAARVDAAAAGRPCPQCSAATLPTDRFCAKCGADLSALATVAAAPSSNACPTCGKLYEPGDRFCGSCGQLLAAEPAARAR